MARMDVKKDSTSPVVVADRVTGTCGILSKGEGEWEAREDGGGGEAEVEDSSWRIDSTL